MKDIQLRITTSVRTQTLQTAEGACVSYILMGYNLQTQIKGGLFWEVSLQFTAIFSQIVGWGGCHVGQTDVMLAPLFSSHMQ